MEQEQYIEERLQNQIDWYSKKSTHCQNWFKHLRLVEIVAAALILPISCSVTNNWIDTYGVSSLGLVVVITSSYCALGKFHENWIEYRTAAETLKHEKFLFLTGTEPYDSDNRLNLLVHRCEGIISKENSQWTRTTNTPSKA